MFNTTQRSAQLFPPFQYAWQTCPLESSESSKDGCGDEEMGDGCWEVRWLWGWGWRCGGHVMLSMAAVCGVVCGLRASCCCCCC